MKNEPEPAAPGTRHDAVDFGVKASALRRHRDAKARDLALLVRVAEPVVDLVDVLATAGAQEHVKLDVPEVVRVVGSGGIETRPVSVGKSDGKMTEIKEGLKEGEEVLLK